MGFRHTSRQARVLLLDDSPDTEPMQKHIPECAVIALHLRDGLLKRLQNWKESAEIHPEISVPDDLQDLRFEDAGLLLRHTQQGLTKALERPQHDDDRGEPRGIAAEQLQDCPLSDRRHHSCPCLRTGPHKRDNLLRRADHLPCPRMSGNGLQAEVQAVHVAPTMRIVVIICAPVII